MRRTGVQQSDVVTDSGGHTRSMRARRLNRAAALTLSAVVASAALSGCSAIGIVTGKAPAAQRSAMPSPQSTEQNAPEPTYNPDGSAAENLPYFNKTNQAFAAGAQEINGKNVVDALAAAGFDKQAMQVSFDKTATGLNAENIFVSVLIDQSCLMGQFVRADRSYTGIETRALGPNFTICNPSTTRTIDW